jgi:uncharacterized membrane protein YidH (DUF202 family)
MTRRIVGIVVIAIGLAALASGGLFWTRREKVIDAGPVQVTRDKHEGVAVPTAVGVIVVLCGVVLVAIPGRART